MKVLTVVGARPQFIKAWPVSRELSRSSVSEILVHTGQHYDPSMSDQFFRELGLTEPKYHLGIGSGSHGVQTGKMLGKLEDTMLSEAPDAVIIYGDTNSTLAGALAAAKLNIPLVHVEAGLRSFNRSMPEEINRVVVDHMSNLLMAPTPTACDNLRHEGFIEFCSSNNGNARRRGTSAFVLVGDVMKDALLAAAALATNHGNAGPALKPRGYYLASLHRPANVDDPIRLREWLKVLMQSDIPVLMPLHPRTRVAAEKFRLLDLVREPLLIRTPLGYLAMIAAIRDARAVLTDSGGVQKEAFMLGVPCISLRGETEWLETLESGWNQICPDPQNLWKHVGMIPGPTAMRPSAYGNGDASKKIVECIWQWL